MTAGIIGLIAGAAGYLVATFWMRPILRYLDLKQQVCSDLIFFANVVNAEGLNDEMKERMWKRVEANRRHSADLTACLLVLPSWYKCWLEYRGHNPEKAANDLMGLSNTFEDNKADRRIERIKTALGFGTSSAEHAE